MDVAVLGATGDVGRQVCTQLIAGGLLTPSSRLQLVGRPGGSSASAAYGLRADLVDAFDERAPLIDVALSPDDVVADVVVATAGRTAPARPGADSDRAALAADNLEVFRSYARALAAHGSGKEVVIVVTNPVELGVAVMADALGRHRVIGMGAWLDTLRFRREIAVSLGVRRHRVGGFAAGEHGVRAVPLWSTVRIAGLDAAERRAAVAHLRRGRSLDVLPQEVADAKRLLDEVAVRDVGEAFALVDAMPPDLRVITRPWMTHQSGAKTAAATAAATVDLVRTLLDGRDIVVAGQVALDGEVDVPGHVLGVPVILGPEGWSRVVLDPLEEDERRQLAASGQGTDAMLERLGVRPAAGADPVVGEAAATPPDLPPGTEPRWEVAVELHAADEVGTVAMLTGVFAARGVSVESLATSTAPPLAPTSVPAPGPSAAALVTPPADVPGRAGTVVLTFRAGARRAREITRTLERLAAVRGVVAREADVA